jgi:pimeloyl-ACP methyl ester carboxylesterase
MAATAGRLGIRLMVPDRPGYGGSDPHLGRTFTAWTRDLADLMDAQGIPRFTILGFSLGAIYAMACAHALAGRVGAIGLAGTLAPGIADHQAGMAPAVFQLYQAGKDGPEGLAEALAPLRGAPEALLEAMKAAMPLPEQAMLVDPDLGPAFRSICVEALRQGGIGMAEDFAMAAADWGFDPADVELPVLLWHGMEDRNAPPSMARALQARLPSGRLQVFPGEGHLCLYGHWEEILETLASGVMEPLHSPRHSRNPCGDN